MLTSFFLYIKIIIYLTVSSIEPESLYNILSKPDSYSSRHKLVVIICSIKQVAQNSFIFSAFLKFRKEKFFVEILRAKFLFHQTGSPNTIIPTGILQLNLKVTVRGNEKNMKFLVKYVHILSERSFKKMYS